MIDIKRTALELALDLEKRGSLEGHYIWSDMLIKALSNSYNEGLEVAASTVENSPSYDSWEYAKEIRALKVGV